MIAVVSLALLGTDSYLYEFSLGQTQTLLLFLLSITLWALSRGNEWAGGAALGLALATKLMGWPILLLLAVKRRWRAVLFAALVVVVTNGLAAAVIGPSVVLDYYLRVGPEVSTLYRSDPWNLSLWTIGWRFFGGTKTMMLSGLAAAPLISWPAVAPIVSLALPIVVAILSVRAAASMRSFAAAFAMLVCVSAVVNPVAWTHYNVLATIAIMWVWWQLGQRGFPRLETWLAVSTGVILYLRVTMYHESALWLSGQEILTGWVGEVSFGASLLTLVPTVGMLLLSYLVWRVERMEPQDATPARP